MWLDTGTIKFLTLSITLLAPTNREWNKNTHQQLRRTVEKTKTNKLFFKESASFWGGKNQCFLRAVTVHFLRWKQGLHTTRSTGKAPESRPTPNVLRTWVWMRNGSTSGGTLNDKHCSNWKKAGQNRSLSRSRQMWPLMAVWWLNKNSFYDMTSLD